MTGVVERNLSQSQILKGIQDKNTVVPKRYFQWLSVMKLWIIKGNQDKCCSFLARGDI